MAIYRVFLENMTEEQKFQTTAKLCQEVLAGVVDGQLPLSESGELVTDALTVLGSKDIKISKPKARAIEDEDVEETAAEVSLAAAKEKILTKVVYFPRKRLISI